MTPTPSPQTMSTTIAVATFREKVEAILGAVYKGIYHIEREFARADKAAMDLSPWPHFEITVRDDGMSTYDFDRLTWLVVLCHDAEIRCEINARANHYMLLRFHPRRRDGDSFSNRHPTLEQAAATIRGYRDLRPESERVS